MTKTPNFQRVWQNWEEISAEQNITSLLFSVKKLHTHNIYIYTHTHTHTLGILYIGMISSPLWGQAWKWALLPVVFLRAIKNDKDFINTKIREKIYKQKSGNSSTKSKYTTDHIIRTVRTNTVRKTMCRWPHSHLDQARKYLLHYVGRLDASFAIYVRIHE